MADPNVYTAMDFQIYPLELFILGVGLIIGVMIGSLNDKRQKNENQPHEQTPPTPQPILQQISKVQCQSDSPQNLILSYSLTTGQSFQHNTKRVKLSKGHLYEYLQLDFPQNQQGFPTSFQLCKSGITKTLKDGQWIKLYNKNMTVPQAGKFYFNVYVSKNEYFVKRQASQKAVGNTVAVSRTDVVVGFFMCKQEEDKQKLAQEVDTLCLESQRESNSIPGITAYGFNGRIYNNGDLRTQEKIIKKNKMFTVLINRDEGFVAYEVEGETVGVAVLGKERGVLVPFVEMFAVGSAVVMVS